MKTQIAKQITRLAFTVLASISVARVAQGSECATAPDAVSDTQVLADKIVSHLQASAPAEIKTISNAEVNEETIMNHKFHKVDRSKEGFNKFDSVGVVTGKQFDGKMQSYGSAVLISPCHVLTNRHVVAGLAEQNNESLKTGNRVYFSVGQAKSCNSGKDFEEQNLNAKLFALGTDDSAGQDWAIVKLDRPVGSDIRPAQLSPQPLGGHIKAVRVGFPYEQVQDKHGFKNSRAQYVRGESAGFRGITHISDKTNYQGMSGGAIFTVGASTSDKFKPTLTGIYVGTNETLNMKQILGTLNEHSPEVIANIQESFKAGHCK